MGYLNLVSLVLGLIAWILPVVNLMRYQKQGHKNWTILAFISISCSAFSLLFQIFYNRHMVKMEDWSALMDVTGAVAVVSSLLLIVTIILNVITVIVYRDRISK